MGILNVRTDEAMERVLCALTQEGRSRSEAVRCAVFHTYMVMEQTQRDADRLATDHDDHAEVPAIQRFMGVVE